MAAVAWIYIGGVPIFLKNDFLANFFESHLIDPFSLSSNFTRWYPLLIFPSISSSFFTPNIKIFFWWGSSIPSVVSVCCFFFFFVCFLFFFFHYKHGTIFNRNFYSYNSVVDPNSLYEFFILDKYFNIIEKHKMVYLTLQLCILLRIFFVYNLMVSWLQQIVMARVSHFERCIFESFFLTSVRDFLFAANSLLQLSILLVMKFTTCSDIFNIFRHSIIIIIIFTQPLRSGRIWHKVNF